MRRTSTLAFLALLCGSLAAQSYKMRILDAQGDEITDHLSEVSFLDDGRVAIYRGWRQDTITSQWHDVYDTLQASALRSIDFLTTTGRLWDMNYAQQIFYSGRADDYGYASIMHMRDLLTEDMAVTQSGYNWYNAELEALYSPDYAYPRIAWVFYQQSILRCNGVINALRGASLKPEQEAVLAEALAIRAMLYLDFAQMYEFVPNERTDGVTSHGANVTGLTVPLLDENLYASGNDSYYSSPRVPKETIALFIEQTLDDAEALIGSIQDPSRELPHKDVIYGLRARLALWRGDYAAAAQAAHAAIGVSDSEPMTIDEMLSTTQGFNTLDCWMWGVQQGNAKNYVSNLANYVSWMSPEWEDGYASLVRTMIGRSLYDRIDDADPRKLLFMAPGDSPLYGATPLINPNYISYLPTYTAVKFRPANGDMYSLDATYTAYPLMRIEEMYFILAEALAHSDPAEARQLLESFMRQYRYESYTCEATDRDDVISEIILQKRIELWGEGRTFFDFKRLNMSVTRDYEGTNFYEASALNTVGMPYWMNMMIPTNSIKSNSALYGYENPWEQTNGLPPVATDFTLTAPAYLDSHDAIPLDSIYMMVLDVNVPEGLTGKCSIEVSSSPDFPLGHIACIASSTVEDLQTKGYRCYASDMTSTINSLLPREQRSEDEVVTAYIRILADDAISQTDTLRLIVPDVYNGWSRKCSFAPTVQATVIDRVDCEPLAGQDTVQLVTFDVTNGEMFDLYTIMYYADSRGNFSLDTQGRVDNLSWDAFTNASDFIYNYVIGRTADHYTFGDAYVSGYTTRDGLVFAFSTDSLILNVNLNMQSIAETQHSWTNVKSLPMRSEFAGSDEVRRVQLQQANDDPQLYRFIAPYQRGHNLMFRADADGQLTMPRQMTFCLPGDTVYAEATGQLTDDWYVFNTTFTRNGVTTDTCTEAWGIEWRLVGTGTYYSYFLDEFPNLQLYTDDNDNFKIKDWGYVEDAKIDLTFTLNGDGTITVPKQFTGYIHPTYGEVSIIDVYSYFGSDRGGSYDHHSGTFSLYVVYIVDAGSWSRDYDTFILDMNTVTRSPSRIQH